MEISTMSNIPIELVQFLIVDDHDFVRRIVSQHLKSCGVKRFSFAKDGAEAIRLLKLLSPKIKDASLADLIGSRPDIAGDLYPESVDFKAAHTYCTITDFGMPNVNGLQLVKAIRCGQTRVPRNTPIILLTGYSDDYVVSTALQLDVNAFILKPVSRNTLWEKVERVLKSDAPVKEEVIYAAVEIPDEAGEIISATPKPANPKILEEDQDKNVRWIPLTAVQPGAELAGDLHGERGTLLLRQGTIFSEGILQKLLDVERMSGFSGKIPIKNVPEE